MEETAGGERIVTVSVKLHDYKCKICKKDLYSRDEVCDGCYTEDLENKLEKAEARVKELEGKLESILNFEPDEEIEKEIEHSCQYFDKALEIEKDIMKSLKIRDYAEKEDLIEAIEDATWYDGDIQGPIEKAREINSDLREWLEYWKDRCETAEGILLEARDG